MSPMDNARATSSFRVGWLTVAAAAAVIAVNAAGLWGIAMARRSVIEGAGRLFRLEIETRARAVEGLISQSRTDLVFLAGSSAIARLAAGPAISRSRPDDWQRQGAEASLLIFLRGHPEVQRVSVLAGKNEMLVEAGWRGGVPMAWFPPPDEKAQIEPPTTTGRTARIRGVFALDSHAATPQALRVVAELNARALLRPATGGANEGEGPRPCRLSDAAGRVLAGEIPEPTGDLLTAEATIGATGWSVPAPWTLTCVQSQAVTVALVEPLARRYRLTLALDLAVMALTLLLGMFVVQQVRRRERLETAAREEARVRELERQLFHSERLATVGRVVAGIAHEINNPLEGMFNYLALAEDDIESADTASAKRRLGGVREGMERVAGIVQQVLVHADPATAPIGPVDLAALVPQTIAFVEARRAFKGIHFTTELEAGPLLASGRSVMLGQVLLNLVLNACEAQPKGGEVTLRAGRDGQRLRVEVADRGPGIAASDLTKIFEPFFSTKGSSGLGLSVCHTIVTQHGGELKADNREGGGALFRMTLPEWTEGTDG
jgi:signal transduction histidine kinase